MTDLEALKTYRYAVAEVQAVGDQLDALRSLPRSVQGARLGVLTEQLEARQTELENVAQQFDRVLGEIRNPRTRMIIRQYYALGLSDEKIAVACGMSTRMVNKIRNRFLHDWAIVQEARMQKEGQ